MKIVRVNPEILRDFIGIDKRHHVEHITEVMLKASTRRNALEGIRDADIAHTDEARLAEIQSEIETETRLIAECLKVIKELDAES